MNDVMIQIENVSKEYKLGEIGITTLKDEFQRIGAKLRKKEDPTRRLDEKEKKKGGKFLALEGVSFSVSRGEAIGLIGHNGAGKSTLLKLITKITSPTKGKIGLNGKVASMLEVGTGFHEELTGRENIYMNGAILGMTKKEIDAKIEDIIEFSEIREFIDTPVKRYSSGMFVKLAFSVAVHLDAEIVLMDEVLAVGDVKFQQKCINKMMEIVRSKKTIIYVSHNMTTIRQLCSRCVVLDKGKVVYDGEVEGGIAKYLDFYDEFPVLYDYVDKERTDGRVHSLDLKKIELLGKECAIYKQGEDVKVKATFKANADCFEVGVRFTLTAFDGVTVGSFVLPTSLTLNKNEESEITFDVDTKILSEGKYSFSVYPFIYQGFGETLAVDQVENAFVFCIATKSGSNLIWKHRNWGHVILNCKNVEKNK